MKSVTLYAPINRELLEELFQNDMIASSYRRVSSGCYEIQMRDTRVLTKYNQPHSVINYIDMKAKIEAKRIRMENLCAQYERA